MKKTLFTFLFTLLFFAQANAQSNSLELLYESAPGMRPARAYFDTFESFRSSRLDANGDGTPDLVITREDEQGNLLDLLVIDLSSSIVNDTFRYIQDVRQTLGWSEWYGLFGFANVVGGDEPEAIFTNEQDVLLYDLSDNTLVWSWGETEALGKRAATDVLRLLASINTRGDDKKELFIFLQETGQLQVWHEKLP